MKGKEVMLSFVKQQFSNSFNLQYNLDQLHRTHIVLATAEYHRAKIENQFPYEVPEQTLLDLVNISYLLDTRRQWADMLDDRIKKAPEDGIPYSKRYIQQETDKHLEKHGFYKTEQGKNIINLGLDPDSENLAFVLEQFDEELKAFLAKITRLRKIIDELEQMGGRLALPPIEVETPEMKIDMPSSPVVPSWGWGSQLVAQS